MRKITQIINEFKRKVSEELGEAEFILFGSHARKDAGKESDVDILVILDRDVNTKVKEAIYDIAYEFSLKYDIVLDVSVYSKEEWSKYRKVLPFAINVEREGVII